MGSDEPAGIAADNVAEAAEPSSPLPPTLELGPVLRFVDRSEATIWMETDRPCEVQVLGHTTTTFTVRGHHYALAIVTGLEPGTTNEYDVALDGHVVWPPPEYPFPPPSIRTLGDGPVRLVFGSCRAAAPHTTPYSFEIDGDDRARGVDSLRAHGLRMLKQSADEWPSLAVFLGDQIYADDASPRTERAIEGQRSGEHELPSEIVEDFEQYTWLYREAWTPDVERWVLSCVPSTMIFDDHDMIDDWNISESWVDEIQGEDWWEEHILGGLESYWIHQHLGNLAPARIAEEGILARLLEVDDGSTMLRQWAAGSEAFTPNPGGYYFSYHRELGDVHLVMIDCRNGRVLTPTQRRMVDEDEWAWIREQALAPCKHLVLACSLPVFVPGGLHGLQQWNEAICDGAWGRPFAWLGEKLRRALDLEDWSAFDRSFREFCRLLVDAGTPSGERDAPSTITLLAGDIHFAYVSNITAPEDAGVTSAIRQVVSSPIRNALETKERRAIEFAISKAGRRLGGWLARSVRRPDSPLSWELEDGPIFANNMGVLSYDDTDARLVVEHCRPDEHGEPDLQVVIDHPLEWSEPSVVRFGM
ncbi:MAG: alkaline phosphatase D family protein [Ilumatobacteraceae bacterium]